MDANKLTSKEELIDKSKEREKMIYNPIVGLEKEDEGVDQKLWQKQQHLKSQGYWSTFKFFCKQSFKDVRRHKCQFCLGFCSVFVVVLLTLIINTLIDKGPVIFLKLAEDSTGEIDAVIETAPIIYSTQSYGKFINYTQIRTLYGDEYNFSGRKLISAQYIVPNPQPSSSSLSSTGLPTFSSDQISSFKYNVNITFSIKFIDTDRENKIKCGTKYSYDKLKLGECLIPSEIALLNKINKGDFIYMKYDVNEELYTLYDHYKVRANDKTGYSPKMGTINAPCKVKDIYSSSGGKQASSDDGSTVFMEMEYAYKWLSPYVEPSDMNPSMIAFRQFLLGDYARPNDLCDYIILTFPEPRTEYYSDSSYDNIQNNVVGYANKILNILGFFPISVTCDILQELQTLSMSLVLIGIVFTIIAALFIIISILLIYSLLMVTVEEKSFEIGIYRMVGLNKCGLITMVLLKAFFFVIPAIISSFLLSILCLWVIYRMFLDSSMGGTEAPVPSPKAILFALLVGLIIPIVSSLIPMKVALSKTLTDALDYAHSKTKAVFVKIIHAKDFDRKPYIIFGVISVLYGVSIYYFLPLSLISLNFSLMLSIFFMILIGMFVGLVLLALNLQRILEIIMVYVFLFYERTSMRVLVLKNLIAHKHRNRMTISIYAMSIGFLIMIVVAYNLQISNSTIQREMKNGSYLQIKSSTSDYISPIDVEPFLENCTSIIDAISWETHDLASPYQKISVSSLISSDELTLIQITSHLYGVTPYYTRSLMSQYIVLDVVNDTTTLDLTEQLYTPRGMQGSGVGGYQLKQLSLDPKDSNINYKMNMFTDNWNAFLRLRGTWSTKFMPGRYMIDKDNSRINDVLISIPTAKKLLGVTTKLESLPYQRLLIKLKRPNNANDRQKVKLALQQASINKDATVEDASSSTDSMSSSLKILDIIFGVIIGSVMFLCYFSLSSSMTSNMIEQKKEIGVLRAIGLTKFRIYFMYMYECFILIFTGCMTGIMIGTMIGWTMMLQMVLFSNIPLSFYFPWVQVIVIFFVSILCAFIATFGPSYSILKHQISEIFRSG